MAGTGERGLKGYLVIFRDPAHTCPRYVVAPDQPAVELTWTTEFMR